MFVFEVLSGRDNLSTLEPQWQFLREACGNRAFYTDWRWHDVIGRHLLSGKQINYVCAYLKGRLVGILPLQMCRMAGKLMPVRALSFPRHDHIQLSDMLLDKSVPSSALLSDLITFLEARSDFPWQYLYMPGVCDGANIYSAVGNGKVKAVRENANAYFDTRDDRRAPIPRKLRHNINRLKRKAEAAYGTVQATSAFRGDELARAFESFMQVEASGNKGEKGTATAILNNAHLVEFYRDLLACFSEDGSARINLLRFGETVAAGQLCLRAGNTWSILKIGYQDELRAFGPGNILLDWFIQGSCADAAIEEINLVTAPEWAARWNPRMRNVHLVFGFRDSLWGHAIELACLCTKRGWMKQDNGERKREAARVIESSDAQQAKS